MSYPIEPAELEQMIAAPRDERLAHFVTKAVETGELWTLAAEQNLLVLGTDDRPQFVVLFPHPDYAMLWFEESGIEEADLVGMDVAGWVEGNLDDLQEAGIECAVFPTPQDEATYLDASDLLRKLRIAFELA